MAKRCEICDKGPVFGRTISHAHNVRPRRFEPNLQTVRALVNGAPGVVITVRGRPFAILGFTVTNGKIIEIDAIADPERVARIAAAVLAP